FSEVKLNRPARRHRAEATGARAHVAEDHERRGAPVPAIEDVGAARLFADGVKAASLDDLLKVFEILTLAHTNANPFGDRGERQRLSSAHSRMLPCVQSSRLFLTAPRHWPAIMPSTIRWSKLRHMFIMWRIAIASLITTGRLTIASVVRIAACGWLMIGWLAIDPVAPVLLSVIVPPCTSSGFNRLPRARSTRSFKVRTRSVNPSLSASFTTGTISPSGKIGRAHV